MIFDSVRNFTILHFTDVKSNKLWMGFVYDQFCFAGWGGMGKCLSFKKHGRWLDSLVAAESSKIKKGYKPAEVEQVLSHDPCFVDRFSERFTEFVLKG
jgi:hypothetical protein